MSGIEPLTWHAFFSTWHANLGWDVAILATALLYGVGNATTRRRRTSTVGWYRAASFGLGLLLLALSVNTAIETYSDVLFWVHMVQHLLLIMVVPALLVVGSPLAVLVEATKPQNSERIRRFLLSGPVSVLTHPLTGLILYTAVIVGTHLTPFMQQMMLHHWLHTLEHLLYLGAGYLFLLPLLGNEPIRWQLPHPVRLLLLFLAMAPDTVVGIVLLQTTSEVFPAWARVPRDWGPSPVHDLNQGGAIMWAFGDGLMMLFILAVMVVYLARSSRNSTAGGWLEGVRRSSLASSLAAVGEQTDLTDTDLDEDEAALAAYNRMLERLHGQPTPTTSERPPAH